MTRHIPVAIYEWNQPSERYVGNKAIMALRLPPTEAELKEELEFLPPFDPSARAWDTSRRLGELLMLTNIMVPMESHFMLAIFLDSLLRQGYVRRPPMSSEHMEIFHEIQEERQTVRPPFRQRHDTVAVAISTALVGTSGMGKTTTAQRFLARYDQVIYHHELDLYQIVYLHFETPKDGSGVKGLLTNIIEEIADLIPNNTYREDHLRRGRATEDTLQSSVRTLLNKHCVGLLIADEIQNVANSRKDKQEVMTALTTLANKSKAPVLYIGTPKAENVLGLDTRMGRRSVDLGMGDWNPLPRFNRVVDAEGTIREVPGEWVHFMQTMWQYCWLRNPVELTKDILDAFYDCTQGIIDLAIKLFIVCQTRAMQVEKSELISVQLIYDSYEDSFKLIHRMIQAMRDGDWKTMMEFEDVRLPSASEMVDAIKLRTRGTKTQVANVRPGTPDFKPRIEEVAKAIGFSPEDAAALAAQVAAQGTASDGLDAISQLVKKARPPRKSSTPSRKPKGDDEPQIPQFPGIGARPDDFRHAIVRAATQGVSVHDAMVDLKFLPRADEVICLD